MKEKIECPICEYKETVNSCLVIGDFIEERWAKNYFSSLDLDFEKIPRQKKKKTPDGYILHNQQRIALIEIKFLEYSKREKEYANNSKEYLHVETFNERLSNEIPRAKDQLRAIQDFNGPKIIYFITESYEADPRAFKNALISNPCAKFDGKELVWSGPISQLLKEDLKKEDPRAKEWDRFDDEFLSAIFCFCCNPQHKHELWLYINEKSKYRLPDKLIDKRWTWHDIYK